MQITSIEWCDYVWNPVTGCFHDCKYCYARRIVTRFGTRIDNGTVNKLHVLEKGIPGNPYPFVFEPTLHKHKLTEPSARKKSKTVFVCSMADLFGRWVPDNWIEQVFAACEKAPQHRYLFLTKNPKRYLELAKKGKLPKRENMWYGSTITTPDKPFFYSEGYNTFLSIEPILADFNGETNDLLTSGVKWVIVGAETGNSKGKVVPEKSWIDAIESACYEGGISLFYKNSVLPIVGRNNMFRQFPWDKEVSAK